MDYIILILILVLFCILFVISLIGIICLAPPSPEEIELWEIEQKRKEDKELRDFQNELAKNMKNRGGGYYMRSDEFIEIKETRNTDNEDYV